jgi:hypothetical protein
VTDRKFIPRISQPFQNIVMEREPKIRISGKNGIIRVKGVMIGIGPKIRIFFLLGGGGKVTLDDFGGVKVLVICVWWLVLKSTIWLYWTQLRLEC